MYIIDSHCHLYYEPYISNLKKTIEDCKSKNVKKLLSISVDLETSKKNIEIATKHDEIYCTVGLHPNNIPNSQKDLEKILNLYTPNSKILGIGEAGIGAGFDRLDGFLSVEIFEASGRQRFSVFLIHGCFFNEKD